MEKVALLLVGLWILGFIVSFVIQTVFQKWFASVTAWGENKGWQGEIAIWNLGLVIIIAGVLTANPNYAVYLLPGLITLSIAFGVNHLAALRKSNIFRIGNWLGMAANFAITALAVSLILLKILYSRA